MRIYSALVVVGLLPLGNLALGQDSPPVRGKEPPATILEVKPPTGKPAGKEVVTEIAPSQIEKEIAFVKLLEARNEVELAKIAYGKAKNEKVRQFASKMEAAHSAARDRLERVTRSVGRIETTGASPDPVQAKDKPPVVRGEPDSGGTPRRGEGSQDPSLGTRPDAGSLDEYNRNTTNPKSDSEADRAQLKKALKEQSTPGTLEKRREVEKSATASTQTGKESVESDRWVSIQQKISAQRLKNALRVLDEKAGAELDECYMAMQIAAHQSMIDADEVYTTLFIAAHRGLISDSLKMAEEHLAEAKQLLGQIRGKIEVEVSKSF